MGCCVCKAKPAETGLNLPEEELALTQLEQSHPFRKKDIDFLCSELGESDLELPAFFEKCSYLAIDPNIFMTPPYSSYLEALTNSYGLISSHFLRLSAILLGAGSPINKMTRIVKLFQTDEDSFAVWEICQMLQDLCYVSTSLHTSLDDRMSVKLYTNRLKTSIPAFIKSFSKAFSDLTPILQYFKLSLIHI